MPDWNPSGQRRGIVHVVFASHLHNIEKQAARVTIVREQEDSGRGGNQQHKVADNQLSLQRCSPQKERNERDQEGGITIAVAAKSFKSGVRDLVAKLKTFRYEGERRRLEIERLNQENTMKSAELRERQLTERILWLFAAGLSGICCIGPGRTCRNGLLSRGREAR